MNRCELRASGIESRVYLQRFPGSSNWNEAARGRITGQTGFVDVLQPQCDLLLDFVQLPTGTIWALFVDSGGGLVVEAIGQNGLVRETIVLDLEGSDLTNFENLIYRIQHDGTRVIVMTGSCVWQFQSAECRAVDTSSALSVRPTSVIRFPQSPLALSLSPQNTSPRVAFSLQNGAQAVWLLTDESCSFAADLESPLLTCTGNGLFVAASPASGRLECYRLNAGNAELVAVFDDGRNADPIVDLLPAPTGNEFFTLRESGRMDRMQIPLR